MNEEEEYLTLNPKQTMHDNIIEEERILELQDVIGNLENRNGSYFMREINYIKRMQKLNVASKHLTV